MDKFKCDECDAEMDKDCDICDDCAQELEFEEDEEEEE